jgi:WavE lipopolysaccharide synthesis protein
MLDSRQISVVVQGPYHADWTPVCLQSIRRFLPGAEIILSTWEHEPVPEAIRAQVEAVVFNADPGMIDVSAAVARLPRLRFVTKCGNQNRQLISTRGGLARATRPYALKLRSDMMLEHAGFLAALDEGAADDRCTQAPIVTTDVMSPDRSCTLYFVHDFASFGRTGDLRRLFAAPAVDAVAARTWDVLAVARHFAVYAEQYLWYHLLSPHFDLHMANCWDRNEEAATQCKRLLASHVSPLTFATFGVTLQKYPGWKFAFNQRASFNWMMRASRAEWEAWHRGDLAARTAGGDFEVREKNQMAAAYSQFLEETCGGVELLHFELNVAHAELASPFFAWLTHRAAPLAATSA